MNHLFCFGLGYVATQLAERLHLEGEWVISGTHRTHKESNSFPSNIYLFDELIRLPTDITHILITIPPNENGDIVFARFQQHIMQLKHLQRIFLLSTTGVYGDHQGNWVDELSALKARNPYSLARIKAERQWLTLGLPVQVLRLSAIYGPIRNELIKARKGQSQGIIKEDHYFSRIHVDDIINIIIRLMAQPVDEQIFNLSDDMPSAHVEVVQYAHQLLGLPQPKAILYDEAQLSEMMKLFYSENKRVSNFKIKQYLNLELLYPTFKEGLKALLNV